jgi:adsorption protein B
VPEADLRNVEQKRIAIMLPAWREADVIEQMLEHNVSRIDYDRDRYDIFCGTYQNDPETQARVDAVAKRFPNVHKVVVPHDGPTSKADCLNWVYQGIILEERARGQRFDVLLMQDAEDIIHPLALRLYSLLVPANEFVQTPVFSLPLPKRSLVAATYIDEFAEHHLKDMRVRERIGGLVPSAGVGSAFDRDAFEQIATEHGQHPFNVDSLTEDYEIGLKFRLANRRTCFACRTVLRADGSEEFIATREFFPGHFRASIRQRSRWILGITLQTWAQIGWRGALPVLYCLFRDRKALFTNTLLLFAYGLVTYVLGREAVAHVTGEPWTVARVVPSTSLLAWILPVNLAFAGWRLGMKARFVGKLYGPWHALLSAPRLVLANIIGIVATLRAIGQYAAHRWTGKPLRWLKTAHEFPAFERLAARRLLGEYLLAARVLSQADLEEALALQRMTGARLGDVLTMSGLASPRAVVEALGRQLDVATADPDPDAIPASLLDRLPEPVAEELDVLPLEEREGAVAVAVVEPLEAAARERLESVLGARVEMRLASGDVLHRARDRAYRRLVADRSRASSPSGPHSKRQSMQQIEADRRAVGRLGLGFCVFHGVVPLRVPRGAPAEVLCASEVHDAVRAEIAKRLGIMPVLVAGPPATVRFALATIEGSLPSLVDDLGLFGLDAVEWRAIAAELPGRTDVARHVGEAREKGRSPLEHLEEIGGLPEGALARARARAFGLRLCERSGVEAAGLLPPRLAAAYDVTVVRHDRDSVDLASPRPTPRLAQQVASLLSPLKVVWSVAPSSRRS